MPPPRSWSVAGFGHGPGALSKPGFAGEAGRHFTSHHTGPHREPERATASKTGFRPESFSLELELRDVVTGPLALHSEDASRQRRRNPASHHHATRNPGAPRPSRREVLVVRFSTLVALKVGPPRLAPLFRGVE